MILFPDDLPNKFWAILDKFSKSAWGILAGRSRTARSSNNSLLFAHVARAVAGCFFKTAAGFTLDQSEMLTECTGPKLESVAGSRKPKCKHSSNE